MVLAANRVEWSELEDKFVERDWTVMCTLPEGGKILVVCHVAFFVV